MAKRRKPEEPIAQRPCDHPGCVSLGGHRAPKSRDNLREYYWFCLEHIKEYNATWNYYQGMESWEIEKSRRSDFVWERPTWPLGKMPKLRDMVMFHLYAQGHFHVVGDGDIDAETAATAKQLHQKDHLEALQLLQLNQPITFEQLRQQYRKLAKKYHPDLRQGCKKAEEQIKKINTAYALLKEVLSS